MYGKQMAYREAEVLSASPERLIALMYEKLLVSLKRGARCMELRDFEGKLENVQRAQDLIFELMGSLDFEKGGEIASRLSSLYTFWSKEVSAADRALDPRRILKVAEMVGDLHEAWVEALRSLEAGSGRVESA